MSHDRKRLAGVVAAIVAACLITTCTMLSTSTAPPENQKPQPPSVPLAAAPSTQNVATLSAESRPATVPATLASATIPSTAPAAPPGIYVATDGLDTNNGTIDKPLLTIARALTLIKPGDSIIVRGGRYAMRASITIARSGTQDNKYALTAFPGEKPVLDFSASQARSRGLNLNASYWLVKGFEITRAYGGMSITGNFNTIEQCIVHHNQETGVSLSSGAANNRIINCDSYCNADPQANYANADGFAPKLTVGDNDSFYGCRSWLNCDDGWDGYMRGSNNITTTLENCWTARNGYLENGTDAGPQANGNGFKMGGGDNSNSGKFMHHFILKNCLSFQNKAKGFDQNNNVGSMTLLNCTGWKNGGGNFVIVKPLNEGQKLTVKNCVSLDGNVQLGAYAIQEKNNWLLQPPAAATDFVSIDPESAFAPRKPDGSLPDLKFMHLATGSRLIEAGVDVGLPFKGKAPDLGAFIFGSEGK